jgi:hypothetical protein
VRLRGGAIVGPAALAAGLTLALAMVVAGCGGSEPSFSVSGPCTVDGRAAGAYPDLEARLPASLGGIGPAPSTGGAAADLQPTTVDSGRSCTQAALGASWDRGVRELRFAGATWDLGSGNGIVSVLFVTPAGQPPLQPTWVEEFYEAGVRASSKAENVEISRPTIDPAGPVWRLDTLNDLSLQTVVVWPSDDAVRVVIVATAVNPDASRSVHDDRVEAAVSQTASRTAR